jgi:hypothetical protein
MDCFMNIDSLDLFDDYPTCIMLDYLALISLVQRGMSLKGLRISTQK